MHCTSYPTPVKVVWIHCWSTSPEWEVDRGRCIEWCVSFLILTTPFVTKIIQITPPVIQHEIITSLPDIINDTEHKVTTHGLVKDMKILTTNNCLGDGRVPERAYERVSRADCAYSWCLIESHIAFRKFGNTFMMAFRFMWLISINRKMCEILYWIDWNKLNKMISLWSSSFFCRLFHLARSTWYVKIYHW